MDEWYETYKAQAREALTELLEPFGPERVSSYVFYGTSVSDMSVRELQAMVCYLMHRERRCFEALDEAGKAVLDWIDVVKPPATP